MIKINRITLIILLVSFAFFDLYPASSIAQEELIIASASWTRPLFRELSERFAFLRAEQGKDKLSIKIVHGAGSIEVRSINEGGSVDIVALASSYDIDQIALGSKKLQKNWRDEFPNDSSPYATSVVFLVRANNPKKIKDWNDLSRQDIKFLSADPETSGLGKYIFLSLMSYYEKNYKTSKDQLNFIKNISSNFLNDRASAAIASTNFLDEVEADALLTSEAEAMRITDEYKDSYTIIYPSISLLLNLPVSIVSQNNRSVEKTKYTRNFVEFLYTKEAQSIFEKYHFHPYLDKSTNYRNMPLWKAKDLTTVESIYGTEDAAIIKLLSPGGLWDTIKRTSPAQ